MSRQDMYFTAAGSTPGGHHAACAALSSGCRLFILLPRCCRHLVSRLLPMQPATPSANAETNLNDSSTE